MGDPRKARKQYKTPSHPWQKNRIEEEHELAVTFGLKNKHEIWKMNTILKSAMNQSKQLVTQITAQAEKEKAQLLKRMKTMGLLTGEQGFNHILSLTTRNIMERRLQTFVTRKGLARSMKQARQLITHGHIQVKGITVTAPSYLVKVNEESNISYSPTSALASADHPERMIAQQEKPKKEEKREKREPKRKTRKREDRGITPVELNEDLD